MRRHVLSGLAVAVLWIALGAAPSRGQQYFDAAGGPADWDGATANWGAASGGPYDAAWASGDAVFEGTAGTVTVSTVSASGLTFSVGGYTLVAGTLTLTGPGVTAAGNATINATLAGSAGLAKAGGGTLTLGGANSYSGGTTVSGGTLAVNADSRLGAAGEGVTLAGGTLRVNTGLNTLTRPLTLGAGGGTISLGTYLNYNGPITGGAGLYASGSDFILAPPSPNDLGVITQNGSRLFINNANALANNAAVVMTGGSRLAFQSGAAPTAPANPIAFASGCGVSARSNIPTDLTLSTTNVTFPAAGSFTFNVDDQPTRGVTVNGEWPALTGGLTVQVGGGNATVGTVTLNAALSGSGGLTKQNPGVLLLAASNSLSGGVTAEGGTVRLGNAFALGPVSALLTVKNGGTLDLAGFSPRVAGLTDTLGFGTIGTGLITNSGDAATLTITRASKAYAGTIAGPVNVVIPTGGSGYQILSGNSTYTGATTIYGSLETWGTNALGSTAVGTVVTNGAGLSMKGKSDPMVFAPEPLAFHGNASFSLNTDDVLKNPVWTGPVTLAPGATMNIVGGGAAGSITITSPISGAGAISKQTALMTLNLAGDNTYSGGTTLVAGTLKLGSATALGAGPVTVQAGTLDLNGNSATIGSLTATGGALVDTGAGTDTATLTVNQTANTTCAIPLSNGVTRALALVKTGNGVLTLSHTNTFTGPVTISGGTLRLGVAAALPSDPVVTAGGTLDMNARNINDLGRSVTIAGPGAAGQAGALANTGGGTESWLRNLTLTDHATVGTTGSKLNVGNVLNGGGYGLTVAGTGEVNIRLSNGLQNLASVTVNSGLLRLESSQSWAGTYTVNAGGRLDTYGTRTVAGAVHLNGGRLANGGTGAMTAIWTGPVTLAATSTVDTAGGAMVLSNAVTGAGALVKAGANALTLAGACDFGGALGLSNGTVTVAGSLACAGGAVAAGATLNGSGTLHARVIDGAAATLTVAGTLAAGALTLDLDVTGSPQGSPHTLVDATGGTLTGRFAAVLGVPPGYAVSYQGSKVLLVSSGTLIRLR